MFTVEYEMRFGPVMVREFATLNEAARYAVSLKREMKRVGLSILALSVDGDEWI